jgi:hypothetical protein
VTDDPFLTLIVEALNLTHPRFAASGGPSFAHEFYHQFRRLWDKAVPVQLGLGHVMIRPDPTIPRGPRPDFLFWQLGEHGQPDRRLGAVWFASTSDLAEMEQLQPDLGVESFGFAMNLAKLARLRSDPGYPHAVCVIAGNGWDIPPGGLPAVPGVMVVFFDTERWVVTAVLDQEGR